MAPSPAPSWYARYLFVLRSEQVLLHLSPTWYPEAALVWLSKRRLSFLTLLLTSFNLLFEPRGVCKPMSHLTITTLSSST